MISISDLLEDKEAQERKRGTYPTGGIKQLLEKASELPRHQQQKVATVLEAFIAQHSIEKKNAFGKGCVIVIAAGNDAGPVSFPANLTNVLSVAASNEFDQPKTKTSADGENWGFLFRNRDRCGCSGRP